MGQLKSFRDLKVYQKLKALHLEVHNETLKFPKFYGSESLLPDFADAHAITLQCDASFPCLTPIT